MKITCGSREVDLRYPARSELLRWAGRLLLGDTLETALIDAFRAGAVATLAAQESSRGARMEAALLEVPDG